MNTSATTRSTSDGSAIAPVEAGFTGRRTAEIVGISYRQLDYWARTDLIRPSIVDAAGSGSRRAYSYRDLLELKVVKSLLDAGIKLELVREVFRYVREQLGEDISSSNIVISGQRSVLVRNGEELVDVLRAGQGVLNILPLAGVKQELDAKIIEFGDPPGSIEPQTKAPGGSAAAANR